jgi:hypothetical protein
MKIFSSVPLDNRFGAGYIIVDADVNVNINTNVNTLARPSNGISPRYAGRAKCSLS